MFVDDSQMTLQCRLRDLNTEIERVKSDIASFIAATQELGLTVNLSKTQAMIIGTRKTLQLLDPQNYPPIIVNDFHIKYVNEAKNLGVWIDNTLSWKKHLSKLKGKVYGALQALKMHKHALTKNVRAGLVQSLIFPHFDYACLVYHGIDKGLSDKLEVVLNDCVRFVYSIPRHLRLHITQFRRDLSWLTAKQRREYFLGCLMYKIAHNEAPTYLTDAFTRTTDVVFRSSARNTPPYYRTPRCNIPGFEKAFSYFGAVFWNQISTKIPDQTYGGFKTALRKHLFTQSLETDVQKPP